jgi:hypothetical protein
MDIILIAGLLAMWGVAIVIGVVVLILRSEQDAIRRHLDSPRAEPAADAQAGRRTPIAVRRITPAVDPEPTRDLTAETRTARHAATTRHRVAGARPRRR